MQEINIFPECHKVVLHFAFSNVAIITDKSVSFWPNSNQDENRSEVMLISGLGFVHLDERRQNMKNSEWYLLTVTKSVTVNMKIPLTIFHNRGLF